MFKTKVDYFIKIGGSLLDESGFSRLLLFLIDLNKTKKIVLSTGSSNLPFIVNNRLKERMLENDVAKEKIRVIMRDVFAEYLATQSDEFFITDSLHNLSSIYESNKVPLLKQSTILSKLPQFVSDGTFTSDSSTCYLANLIGANKYIKLTNVYGIKTHSDNQLIKCIDTKSLSQLGRTCVDESFIKVLDYFKSDCWIVNGNDIDNLKVFFSEKTEEAKFTYITSALLCKQSSIIISNEYVFKNYLNRLFTSTEPPIVDGKIECSTRKLKAEVKNGYSADIEKWFFESSIEKEGWQNKLAFEVAGAIEELSSAILSGEVSITYTMMQAADQIIEDWPICYGWIQSYRNLNIKLNQPVPFHRRYAEILSLISYNWIKNNFPKYSALNQYLQIYGSSNSINELLKKYLEIENNIIDNTVLEEIKKITKI